jgi:hypothetical protein
MIVKVELSVLVDPDEWAEAYSLADDSAATVAADVQSWVERAVSNHPEGLLANALYTPAQMDSAFEDGAVL